MSKLMLAGGAALIAAPLLAIVSALVAPTSSDEAADQVAAFVDHRGAAIGSLTLGMIALGLLVAGTIWLATVVARHSPGLAVAGGVLAVFSYFVIAFENGASLLAAAIPTALDQAQATTALDAVEHSAGVSVVEPLTVLGVVGYALLALGLRRTAAPGWAAVALVVGAAVETTGFAVGSTGLIVAGFAVLAVAAAGIVRGLVGAEPAAARTALPVTGTVQ